MTASNFISKEELALLSGKSVASINIYIQKKIITPSAKQGRRLYFDKEASLQNILSATGINPLENFPISNHPLNVK